MPLEIGLKDCSNSQIYISSPSRSPQYWDIIGCYCNQTVFPRPERTVKKILFTDVLKGRHLQHTFSLSLSLAQTLAYSGVPGITCLAWLRSGNCGLYRDRSFPTHPHIQNNLYPDRNYVLNFVLQCSVTLHC
jgi:hypothetical protein